MINTHFSVLSATEDFLGNTTYINESIANVEAICGANFCPGVNEGINPNFKPPAAEKIQLISGIYLGCMVVACLIVAFGVDSLSRYVLLHFYLLHAFLSSKVK